MGAMGREGSERSSTHLMEGFLLVFMAALSGDRRGVGHGGYGRCGVEREGVGGRGQAVRSKQKRVGSGSARP